MRLNKNHMSMSHIHNWTGICDKLDKSEQDISFEEMKSIQGVDAQKQSMSQNNLQGTTKMNTTDAGGTISETVDTNASKNEQKETKFKKKPFFDPDSTQLDLFSPFPIELFNSDYIQKGLQRLRLKSKIKNNFKEITNSYILK